VYSQILSAITRVYCRFKKDDVGNENSNRTQTWLPYILVKVQSEFPSSGVRGTEQESGRKINLFRCRRNHFGFEASSAKGPSQRGRVPYYILSPEEGNETTLRNVVIRKTDDGHCPKYWPRNNIAYRPLVSSDDVTFAKKIAALVLECSISTFGRE
jgi:hypothetical protein